MLVFVAFSLALYVTFDASLAASDETDYESWRNEYNSTYFKECWSYFESFENTFMEMMDNEELPNCFYVIAEMMEMKNKISYEEFEKFLDNEYENMPEDEKTMAVDCLDKIDERLDKNTPVRPTEKCKELLQELEEIEMSKEMDT